MSEMIYSAVDVTTDSYVSLHRNVTPWTSWDVNISPLTSVFGGKTTQFDSLIDAAHAVANAVELFEDGDAPDAEQVLTDIAAHFDDDKIYLGYEEPDGGGVFLINEYEWDEEDCECSEFYRHRGEHTPGCPMDDGERLPLDEEV